jgi:hypothetical protein
MMYFYLSSDGNRHYSLRAEILQDIELYYIAEKALL